MHAWAAAGYLCFESEFVHTAVPFSCNENRRHLPLKKKKKSQKKTDKKYRKCLQV